MLKRFIVIILFALVFLNFLSSPSCAEEYDPDALVRSVVMSAPDGRQIPLDKLVERGQQDMIASLILAMRFRGNDPAILEAVSALAGTQIGSWFEAMVWQQNHPGITPHTSYRPLKIFLYSQLDLQFLRFLGDDRAQPENLNIRLEEITWGGVKVGGIPALDYSPVISADEANYLFENDLVFGASVNGETRAYPLRVLGWHEMANDMLGGTAVSLSYCTLCGTGILYEGNVDGWQKPFTFDSSGLLYRSNKLMFDRQTDSLWNQFTGKPVSGKLQKSGIQLISRPLVVTTWGKWKEEHPGTTVLSLNTGYKRDYSSAGPYKNYFASSNLIFPVKIDNESGLTPKDKVFGIVQQGARKAWPIQVFDSFRVINDQVGSVNVVLMGDSTSQTVRAYNRVEETFHLESGQLVSEAGVWEASEEYLSGPKGEKLTRVPGRISYWFAWNSFMGSESELYKGQ